MTEARHVLLLSSSAVSYSEAERGDSLLALLEQELNRQRSEVAWRCSGTVLYVTPDMAARALNEVASAGPDIILLRPTSQAFMHDDVVSAIRYRWPRLYRTAVRIADTLRGWSGGERWGGASARGLIFRIPRWVAIKLFGVAPRVPVEQAAECVKETLDSLLRLEDVDVLCQISVGNTPSGLPPREHARRRDYFTEALRSYCSARRIPFSDVREALKSHNLTHTMARDQYHPARCARAVEAEQMAAQVVLAAVGRAPAPTGFSSNNRPMI